MRSSLIFLSCFLGLGLAHYDAGDRAVEEDGDGGSLSERKLFGSSHDIHDIVQGWVADGKTTPGGFVDVEGGVATSYARVGDRHSEVLAQARFDPDSLRRRGAPLTTTTEKKAGKNLLFRRADEESCRGIPCGDGSGGGLSGNGACEAEGCSVCCIDHCLY